MTLEFDLIRRYQGAFTAEDCDKCIEYIENFDTKNILTYDTEKLNEVDNKTINITHGYDLSSYSFFADLILPKFKPCIDEYIDEEQQEELHDYFIDSETDEIEKALEKFDGEYEEFELKLFRIKFLSDFGN